MSDGGCSRGDSLTLSPRQAPSEGAFDKLRRDSGQDCRRDEARFDKLTTNGLGNSSDTLVGMSVRAGGFHNRVTGRRLVHLGGLSHG